jgi:hypothetical protein
MSAALAVLQQRLRTLVEAGIDGFDPPGAGVVQRLLELTAGSASELADYLRGRSEDQLGRLEAAFVAARLRAEASIERLARAELGPRRSELEALLGAGKFCQIERLARRHRHAPPPLRAELLARHKLLLEAAVRARGIDLGEATRSDGSAETLATTLYRDAVASARASLTLVRAAASLPQHAGHYNAQQIAVRTLEALQPWPAYLKAQLARLELLATLPAPDPAKKKPGRSRSRVRPRP